MKEKLRTIYEFDEFRLIPSERQLFSANQSIALPPKAFQALVLLVEKHGRAVTKEELISKLWPDSFVEESNLNHYISVLRKTLSNGNDRERYLETIRGYGFRFNADVRTIDQAQSAVLLHRRTQTHVVLREEQSESLKIAPRTETETSVWRLQPLLILLAALLTAGLAAGSYFAYSLLGKARSNFSVTVPASSTKIGENPNAREAYLKGRYFWNKRTHDEVVKAAFEFKRALAIDPNFAPAYDGLADCMLMGMAGPGSVSAKDLALKALSIDGNLAEGHATLAYFIGAVEWDWSGAEAEFQRAISLDPTYATARHWHAYNLASLGRLDEAIAEIKKAESLDPLSVIIKTDVGHILYLAHRYDEAEQQYLKALEMNRDFRVAHWRLGEVYIGMARFDEAIMELQEAIKLDNDSGSAIEAWLACAYAGANRQPESLAILQRRTIEAELRSDNYEIAIIYAALGKKEPAFQWLDKAVNDHQGPVALLKVEPMLDNLRDDARFSDLLRRMGLSS